MWNVLSDVWKLTHNGREWGDEKLVLDKRAKVKEGELESQKNLI